MTDGNKKPMTIDDLAVMVPQGFEHVASKEDVGQLSTKVSDLDHRMDNLEHTMEALNSNVNNYLELSENVIPNSSNVMPCWPSGLSL